MASVSKHIILNQPCCRLAQVSQNILQFHFTLYSDKILSPTEQHFLYRGRMSEGKMRTVESKQFKVKFRVNFIVNSTMYKAHRVMKLHFFLTHSECKAKQITKTFKSQ